MINERLGFTVKTKIRSHPKVYLLTEADAGSRLIIKIGINTRELTPSDSVEMRTGRGRTRWEATRRTGLITAAQAPPLRSMLPDLATIISKRDTYS